MWFLSSLQSSKLGQPEFCLELYIKCIAYALDRTQTLSISHTSSFGARAVELTSVTCLRFLLTDISGEKRFWRIQRDSRSGQKSSPKRVCRCTNTKTWFTLEEKPQEYCPLFWWFLTCIEHLTELLQMHWSDFNLKLLRFYKTAIKLSLH